MAEFRLATLLEAARLHFESAEQKLAQLRRRWDEARGKLAQLEQFQAEYREGLRGEQRAGVTGFRQQDYLAFLAKLDRAREQQTEEVARCKQGWEAGFAEWQDKRIRLDALRALEERHRAAELVRERRQDQKLQDEFAARRGRNLPDLT